jgi:HEAT repeat protein
MNRCSALLVLALSASPTLLAQQAAPQTREAVTPQQLAGAIEKLGTLDFAGAAAAVRSDAGRTVRRAAAAMAVPALIEAVRSHKDSYVRFRALVLLSGFNDPRTRDVMNSMLGEKDDRLRAVAYSYFGHYPDTAVLPRLIDALSREESEFVRPALTRAIVAHATETRARETVVALIMKGQDFFRSPVIEAAGDYKVAFAFAPLTEIAKLNGPLQDDAVIALGKIGDKRALETFAGLQRSAPKTAQPAIAAAICLIGVNCSSHQAYLTDSLKFGIAQIGYQELVRNSAAGLAALAVRGNEESLVTLIDQGGPTRDPARAAIALAIGTVALRNTPLFLAVLEKQKDPAPAMELLGEAFDMLEEDFEEERFFVFVRRTYWQAAASSPARKTAEALIRKLEF